jgi:pimeloyl-ACP methyl ester carboxylesterase
MRFIKILVVLIFLAAIGGYYFVYVDSSQATEYFIRYERDAAKLTRKEIVLADGMRYVYLEGGHGDPLILLHGFGADKDHFTRVAKFLTPHYHVIIPDLLGFGESSHPTNVDLSARVDYSAHAQADRVRALAKALDLKSVHLGGNSMGGEIALAYAAAHPSEVDSLWLISPAGVWSAPQSELAKIVEGDQHNVLLIRNVDDFYHAFNFVMSKPPMVPRPILNVLAQNSIQNEKLSEQIFTQITNDSIEQRVTGLKTPALIVWGDQDRVINYLTAEILYKLMPRSRVIIMNGIGHLPMVENPEQCAEDYLYFRFKQQAPG